MKCLKCGKLSKTNVKYKINKNTHKKAGTICILGGCLGCFTIPYLTKGNKDAYHFCGKCNNLIGKYHYAFGTDK